MTFLNKFKDAKAKSPRKSEFTSMKDLSEGLRSNLYEAGRKIMQLNPNASIKIAVQSDGSILDKRTGKLVGYCTGDAFYFDPFAIGLTEAMLEKMFGRNVGALLNIGECVMSIDERSVSLEFYQDASKFPFSVVKAVF